MMHSLQPERSGCSADPRPLRVCFISPLGYGLYQPAVGLPFGGKEVQFHLLAGALAEDPAFAVSVLTTVSHDPGNEQHGAVTVITRQGRGRLTPRPARPLAALRGYLSAFADVYRTMTRIDADVYLHAGAGVEVGAYALICRLRRKRFVFVVASPADLARPSGEVAGPLRWLFPLGVRLAHAVVCRTREQQELLRAGYGREGVLVTTGFPMEVLSRRDAGGEPTILWVGRAHPLKQPDLFLDLAERLPDQRCTMVIMRDPAHEDLLKRVRERANRSRNMAVYEDVPFDRIDRFFEQAALLVNTSTHEGFPNTFIQAAMHCIPIVSWRVDPDGILEHYRMGRCASGSFDRLLAAVRELGGSAALRKDMGERAGAYARAQHDLRESSRRLKTLITSLASGAAS
jgi:glycosyltransferase involved in cell wall biosynthesis